MRYHIGETAEVSRVISETDIIHFAEISGDHNPVHIDEIEAKNSIFGQRIAHGFLVGSIISNVIGMQLPGPGTIYMEQNLKFKKPVFIGDTITAHVEISEIINEKKNIFRLSTSVVNQDDMTVIDGYAIVKAPEGEAE
ncbi:MAG: MaoC family dehydratase [Lachnospiraceae bacterium]|nr:MaoC family dehydratase [Lachnospiraceae bacterium]